MDTAPLHRSGAAAPAFVLVLLFLAGTPPAGGAGTPQLISPGAPDPGAVAELRCPTFSWAGVEGASGYELAILRLARAAEVEPTLVARVSLPRHAQSWTPSLEQCLARGDRYAWSVATATAEPAGGGALDWAPALLFDVAGAPSEHELEAAFATMRRYLDVHGAAAPAEARAAGRGAAADVLVPSAEPLAATPRSARLEAGRADPPEARPTDAGAAAREVAAATAPTLGAPSLRLDRNVSLGAASNLFKDGSVLLWDDTDGNTALGRAALSSVTTGTRNTAVGRRALERTTGGPPASYGSDNTAVGDGALRYTSSGRRNTAIGAFALYANTTGHHNTATGYRALQDNSTGSSNVAGGAFALYDNTTGFQNVALGINALGDNTVGYHNTAVGTGALHRNTGSRNLGIGRYAGFHATSGVDNIFIGSGAIGVAGETHTIRIGGTASGTGSGQQNRTFINGIRGTTTAQTDAVTVVIDSAGQLGTISSSRAVKRDIRELGAFTGRLLALRPVAFRYRQHVAADPGTPFEFGLIAEEVAEVFPELVVYDAEGRPETVKYHLLSSLLLGTLLQQHGELEEQRSELARFRARLAAVEGSTSASRRHRHAPARHRATRSR